jgi:hypothetical protein
MRLRHAMAIGAIGLTALPACGSEDKERPTAKPAATTPDFDTTRKSVPASAVDIPTTKPGGPFIGAWHAKLSSHQALEAGDVRLAGAFRLVLRTDGTYATFNDFDGPSKGHYAMGSDRRLVSRQDKGCDVFTGGSGSVGVYRWTVGEAGLKLTNLVPETGGCTGRTQQLVFPLWQPR